MTTYNKSAIMKKAWSNYRRNNELIEKYSSGLNKGAVKFEYLPFSHFLKQAWAQFKSLAEEARWVASQQQTPALSKTEAA